MTAKKTDTKLEINSTIARLDDGTIQITFQIPFKLIRDEKKKVLATLTKDIEIPGFRKGMAPIDKVEEKLPPNTVIERILNNLLPSELTKIIEKEKLRLAVYPKLELVSAKENETWQVRATTCEIPEIDLGDYKAVIQSEGKQHSIWTPKQGADKKEKTLTQAEKEQKVIEILLKNVKAKIPKILIEEDVNSRLSQLLASLDKLGLTLDGYLASINKNVQSIRDDYERQARDSILLELSLNKIAENENITIKDEEVDDAIKTALLSQSDGEDLNSSDKRRLVYATLKRRKVLSLLTSYL